MLILFFLLLALRTSGQPEPQYKVRYLGLKEGLSSRDIKDIYQDDRGVIWIATANGLNRYDGRKITTYTNSESSPVRLPTSHIRSIAEDNALNLLLCTDAGLVALDPTRRSLVSPGKLGFPDSIMQQTNCRMERLPDKRLLLLSGAVIYCYERGQLRTWFHLPEAYAPNIKGMCYSNKDSTLYLRTNSLEIGLLAIRNKQMESLNFPIRVKDYPQGVAAIFNKQSHGMLNTLGDSMTLFWQTGPGARLFINRKAKQFERIKTEMLPDVFPPWRAVQQYLNKLDDATLSGSMRHSNLRLCLKDDRDVYWMGTDVGVFMVKKTGESAFRQLDFLKNISVRSIAEYETGQFLIGTYAGLFKYDSKGGEILKMPDIKTVLDMVPAEKDRYWVSLERFGSLYLFDNKTNLLNPFYPHSPALAFVYDFAQSDSTVWLASTIEEVYCLHISDGRVLSQMSLKPYLESLRDIEVKVLLPSRDGSVWVASEGGLYRLLPGKRGKMIQDTASVPGILRKLKINALYEDRDGRIWMGTNGSGLALFSPDSGKLQWYSNNDGLAHNVVFSILDSHEDSLLWIGTQEGLSCLQTSKGLFRNYYKEDGLADNEFNTGARYRAKDGNLYFGGLNGVTYFNPAQFSFSPTHVKASLTIEMPNAGTDGSPVEWFPVENEQLVIPASETYLEIRFSSNEIFDTEKVRCRYTISGLYEHWQYLDVASKLILRNLSPGKYHLCVQVMTASGQWSAPFKISLHKLPHYYQTWWFRGLMVSMGLGLLYGVYRLRVWQIRQEYDMRSRIVNDLHDDLGSRLYAMRAMASKIALSKAKAEDIHALVAQFDATSKNAYVAMRDFIWAFDPQNDRLENLVERMTDFAENTIRPLVQELKISNGVLTPGVSLAPIVKHHALMVYQEILTNASKHTVSTSLDIGFVEKKHHLCIHILNRHDGVKNVIGPLSGQKGKESIDARLRAINGQLEWLEEDGIQEVSINIPL